MYTIETIRSILAIIILVLTSISIVSSITILFLIYLKRHQHSIQPLTRLTLSTYVATIISSYALLDTYASKIFHRFDSKLQWDSWWCYVRACLLHIGLCSIYHSYVLQTFCRFVRIIFYKYRILYSYSCVNRLIVGQWISTMIFVAVIFFLNHFQYIYDSFHCQIPLTDIQGLIISSLIVYYLPMAIMVIMYLYIIYFINRTGQIVQQNRRRANQRDVIVIRRIIVLITLLLFFCLPSIIIWIIHMITNYWHSLIYHIQWFTFSCSLAILPFASALVNPHFKHLISFNREAPSLNYPMRIVPLQHHQPPIMLL